MSFPGYAEYTESQLEYIGPFPSNWDLVPFFSKFIERKESNKGMKNDNLLSLSYGRIIPKDINTLDGLLPASYETYQVVHPGDLVFRLTDLQNDKRSLRSAIVTEEGIITSAYLAVRPKAMNPDFANHLFRCYDQLKVFYSMGGGLRQSMKYDDMKWLPVVSPSQSEQTQIARFLDHETAKIDALIAEQKRLIKLLQEKRLAVISHAVTKGLDPNVAMKDSGVEWLGEVPAHWGVAKLSHVLFLRSGDSITSNEIEDTGIYPVYGGNGLRGYTEKFNYSGRYNLIGRQGALCGNITIAENKFFASEHAVVCTPIRVIDDIFFYYLLTEMDLGQYSVSAAQPGISVDRINQLKLPLPDLVEQNRISEFLERKLSGQQILIDDAQTLIELLKERRCALISAAVTGKIDVRDWQPPADESAFAEDVQKAGMEASA